MKLYAYTFPQYIYSPWRQLESLNPLIRHPSDGIIPARQHTEEKGGERPESVRGGEGEELKIKFAFRVNKI